MNFDWAIARRVRVLVFGISIYLLFVSVWTWVLTTPVALAGRADFRQFYAAGAMLRAGEAKHLYDYSAQREFQDRLVSPEPTALPFVSPAYHALFFLPFSVLSYRNAYFQFLAINIALLGVSFALLRPWTHRLQDIFRWLPAAMFASFAPIVMALIQGQDSILLTTLLIAAFVLLTRKRELWAGILIGLGLFKLQIVLPITLLFLIWRRWKFSLGFGLSAGVLTAISVWLTGIDQASLYLKTLLALAGLRQPPSELARYPITLEQMANVHGLVYGLCGRLVPRLWLHLLAVLLSAVVLLWTAHHGFRFRQSSMRLLLAVPCSILVSHHTYVHDLSYLLLPVILLLDRYLPSESTAEGGNKLMRGMAALAFVAPTTEFFSASHFYLISLVVLGALALAIAVPSQSNRNGGSLQGAP